MTEIPLLAGFRLARLVIADSLLDEPRAAVFARLDEGGPAAVKLAEGLRCYWCVGAWCSLAAVLLERHRLGRIVNRALAVSAVVGFLGEAAG